jgi:hypothetical protein
MRGCMNDESGLTLEENVLVTSKCVYTGTHPTRLYLKNTQIKNEYTAFSIVFFFFLRKSFPFKLLY